MQRRLRIALAVTAAAGAALLGTGTAFADSFTDILGGSSDTSQIQPSSDQGGSDADSDDSDSDSSDSTDASDSSSDDDNSADDSSSDDN